MPYLTLNMKIQGCTVLVVGGGAVACRKVTTLLRAGARVRVVALSLESDLESLRKSARVEVRLAPYRSTDLNGVFLAVAASDNNETNAKIARDARERGILVTAVNAPELGNCAFPAILRRGSLEIAVSSGGRCPGFSVAVRDYLADLIGADFGAALEQLAAEREKLLTEGKGSTYNSKIVRMRARQLIAALRDTKETA